VLTNWFLAQIDSGNRGLLLLSVLESSDDKHFVHSSLISSVTKATTLRSGTWKSVAPSGATINIGHELLAR